MQFIHTQNYILVGITKNNYMELLAEDQSIRDDVKTKDLDDSDKLYNALIKEKDVIVTVYPDKKYKYIFMKS
jgi:hypothetical protein